MNGHPPGNVVVSPTAAGSRTRFADRQDAPHRLLKSSQPGHRIFCAVDTADLEEVLILAELLSGEVGGLKLGATFFTAHGPAGVRRLIQEGHEIFLDLKFHDIPNTVSGAVRAAAELGVGLLTVHASGGRAMLEAAVSAPPASLRRPAVIGVTVLTSLGDDDLDETGQAGPAVEQVRRLAGLAVESGLDGIVCAPREVAALRDGPARDVALIVPGVRPEWSEADDQKRVATPRSAIAAGADFLVIGRPITQSDDPVDAVRRIADEIGRN